MTQGVKLAHPWSNGVSEVKPAGDSTPARPKTVAAVGNALQGTGEAVLGLVGEL